LFIGWLVHSFVRSHARSFRLRSVSLARPILRTFFASSLLFLYLPGILFLHHSYIFTLSFVHFPLLPSFVPFYVLLFCLVSFFFTRSYLVRLSTLSRSGSRVFTPISQSIYVHFPFRFFQSPAFLWTFFYNVEHL